MTDTVKDYVGNEMSVGDGVVFVQKGYRNFWRGVIDRISPSGATIWIKHERTNTEGTETKQSPCQVMKVLNND